MKQKEGQQESNTQSMETKNEPKRDYWLLLAKALAILGLPILIIGVLFTLWSFDAIIILKTLFLREADFFEYLLGTWSGTVPTGMQPDVLYGNASLVHDLGIILSTLGLIFLFVAATYIVRELLARPSIPKNPKEYFIWFFKWSDSYFVLTSILLLIAWAGIWVFIHQAYIIELETWRETLANPELYAFLGLTTPSLLRWGIIIEIITVAILGIFVYGFLKRKELGVDVPRALPDVAAPPKRAEWRGWFKTAYINSDWLFYFIIFIIYIFIAFGLWIFLFEGFFAAAKNIAIKWALLAIFPGFELIWPHEFYYFAGIILEFTCFGILLTFMKWVSRDPEYALQKVPDRRLVRISVFAARMKKSGKWFALILAVNLIFLIAATFLFLLGFNLIPLNEVLGLFYHRLSQRIMFVWAVIMFYLIIIERSGERIKLDEHTKITP
ncbi:MAG: hypothetical protein ACFFD8_04965 [Candidatus Thorarchaeota archaeon]